jgi:hypothetical protein
MGALTVRRSDNGLYGTSSGAAGTTLYHISSENGDFDSVGQIPVGGIAAIAFSAADLLFLADTKKALYMMNGITGTPTFVGTMNVQVSGLAFDPATGELWGSAHDSTCVINTKTGVVTFVGSGYPGIGHSSIAFSPFGTLYGVFDNALVVIDRGTGGATVIGLTGLGGLQHIAMRNDASAAGVAGAPEIPRGTKLEQNYPNPFNPASLIRYTVAVSKEEGVGSREVKLVVYDVLGREVAELVNETKSPGNYEVQFNASALASGIYFYRLSAGSFVQTRKMVLMR